MGGYFIWLTIPNYLIAGWLDWGVLLSLGFLLRFLGSMCHPCGTFKKFLPYFNWNFQLVKILSNVGGVCDPMNMTEPGIQESLLITSKT